MPQVDTLPKVKTLRQTCHGMPSQWEGATSTGKHLYIRLRHGVMRVGFGQTLDEAVEDMSNEFDAPIEFEGIMSTEEMMTCTQYILDWQGWL